MKIIKYNLIAHDELGAEIKGAAVTMGWSEENEAIARAEAWNGEIVIEDDGQPEPVQPETTDDVLNALLGVTE